MKHGTGITARVDEGGAGDRPTPGETAFRTAFGAIQWPWLLRALHGGRRRDKRALLERLGLPGDALPKLGSWKADTVFLRHIADAVERLRPEVVVELGAGASTLVCAQSLRLWGAPAAELHTFDQHADFVGMVEGWLGEYGLAARIVHARLARTGSGWPGLWYSLPYAPERIDLLVIDGPPWAIHPFVRGAADSLFDRIAPGGMVLLDDAARPGERLVARRWAREWPDFDFRLDTRGAKGTLMGVRRA